MKLIEALGVMNEGRRARGEAYRVLLGCGFEPLHLRTFFGAHLQKRAPGRRVEVVTGAYGDLAGTLERSGAGVEAAAVVVEWSDLDPRLGVRAVGGWAPRSLADIVRTAAHAADRVRAGLEALTARGPIAFCEPTLPLPPASYTPAAQASAFDMDLDAVVARLAGWAVRHPRIRVVRGRRLDTVSPPGERLDVAGELRVGFPYRQAHADVVGELLAGLVEGPRPRKGIITDLDETLWRGTLGEAGVAGVTWHLAEGGHEHALYQQLLAALAESGVLVGIASKNDAGLVEEALRRPDLLLARDRIHPVQASWGAKSEAVDRILRAWNIGADGAVFVDDSAMELAEVAAAHPGIECVRYPAEDPAAVWTTLERLRDLFGKGGISDEDGLRLDSIRAAAVADASAGDGRRFEAFLADAAAEIAIDARLDADAPRPLELVNKTNQFTLNGRRFTEGQWRALLARAGAFLLRVSYRDRFGPLGTIAVLAGRHDGATLTVDVWVMSCRAFSRRIEHQCLRQLLRRFAVEEVTFDYAKTDRNGPLQAFLATLLGTSPPGTALRLSRADIERACPTLHHTVKEAGHD